MDAAPKKEAESVKKAPETAPKKAEEKSAPKQGNSFAAREKKDELLAIKRLVEESDNSIIAGLRPTAFPIIFGTKNISWIT